MSNQSYPVGNPTRCDKKIHRGQILGLFPGFRGCTVWFTGLCSSGKTTISSAVEAFLLSQGIPCYTLDGDNLRSGLCKDLDLSQSSTLENNRRAAEVAKLFADSGMITLCSFVTPLEKVREVVKNIHLEAGLTFFEVFVDTPLEVCEERDVKGLYKQAKERGKPMFDGVDSIFERPQKSDLVLSTVEMNVDNCVEAVVKFLLEKEILPNAILFQS